MARPQKVNSDDVLRRAMHLFWRNGCDDVTTRDLEQALDLRAPAIYRRYRSKTELLARCVDHYVEHIVLRRITQILEAAPSALQGLHVFFVSMLEPHSAEPGLRGCLLTNLAAHRDTRDPEVGKAVARGLNVIHEAFRAQIARAVEDGELAEDTDTRAVAAALFLTLQGLLTMSRAGSSDLEAGVAGTFALLGMPPPVKANQ